MEFTFKKQQYQEDAVNAVVGVFEGQIKADDKSSKFRRDPGVAESISLFASDLTEDGMGYKNPDIHITSILDNIKSVQQANNIHESSEVITTYGCPNLDVEMETGTGKTYVYIKTMFELNKQYGWTKFIVVVPSIAIREGVKKSFEMTVQSFYDQYKKKARFFVYDSKNLNQIDTFATDSNINVMIINTQAFAASLNEEKNVDGRKGDAAARIIFSKRENFGYRRPIDVISATRPIIILDEPQKMGGKATKGALEKFKPLFTINYSATHKDHHNLVYVLDAVDAYNQKLVKQIEVKGFEVKNLAGSDRYIYFENIILSTKEGPKARVEFEVRHKSDIKRERRILKLHDNIYELSNNLEEYKGYTVADISVKNNIATISFTNGLVLEAGDTSGDKDELNIRRIQIRETIKSHFEKEENLFNRGIKTLSLFFIDEVAKYREYDENGNPKLGIYGKIFEEEYADIYKEFYNKSDNDEYKKYLKKIGANSSNVHMGYFSIDKQNRFTNSTCGRGEDTTDDISAYDLIMKNKERLLSFEEPTRFIFSHSALREGWDNPNIFQVCTLKQSNSTVSKRQEVGRGMRLCVDKFGNRMDAEELGAKVHDVNVLTVVASESYYEFAQALQKDIVEDLYDRPLLANFDYFNGKSVVVDGTTYTFDTSQASLIYSYLLMHQYIEMDGKVTEKYRSDRASEKLMPIPFPQIEPAKDAIYLLVDAIFDPSVLNKLVQPAKPQLPKNALRKDNFDKKEFQELWKRINHKYAYKVTYDTNKLIEEAIKRINDNLYVKKLVFVSSTAKMADVLRKYDLEKGDSFKVVKTSNPEELKRAHKSSIKYDLIGELVGKVILTRKTVAKILAGIKPEKFNLFESNPEDFIIQVAKFINEAKTAFIIEGITYDIAEGNYSVDIFTANQRRENLNNVIMDTKKHITDLLFVDGQVETNFANELETHDEVCVYAKLPRDFSIPTPVGDYAPDWAIAFKEGTVKYVYFVAETKGSTSTLDLRPIEQTKINCARKLFYKLSNQEVRYEAVASYGELMNVMTQDYKA